MSFYATIQGSVTYTSEIAFQKVVNKLRELKQVNDEGMFIDDGGDAVSPRKGGNCNRETLTITVDYGCYRNLTRCFDFMFEGGEGKFVWTSIDGVFEGGVCDGTGKDTCEDLDEWAKKNGWKAEDIPDEDTDERCEYQFEVEMAFHDSHS